MNAFSRRLALGVLGLVLGGCGAKQGSAVETGSTKAPKERPGIDVRALMARESAGLTPRKVAAHGIRAVVLSTSEPSVVVERGRSKLIVQIGAEAGVECLIYAHDPLPGSTFVDVVERMKQEFEVQQVTLGAMTVAREAPVTPLAIVYATKQGAGKALSQFKLAFHSRLGSSSLCMHDELGYEKSFAAVARSFFESLERGKPDLDASYVEIFAGEINEKPAGHDRNLVFMDQGSRKLLSMSLLMVQTGPAEIMAQDASSVITIDERDRVAKGHWIEAQNGGLSLDVELERVEGNRYRFAGTRRGAPVKGELVTDDPLGLPSSLWTQKQLKARLARPAAFELGLEQYRPDDDPGAVSRLDIVRRAGDPPRAVRIKVKDAEAMSVVDEQGRDRHSEVIVEGAKVVLDRTYERGE